MTLLAFALEGVKSDESRLLRYRPYYFLEGSFPPSRTTDSDYSEEFSEYRLGVLDFRSAAQSVAPLVVLLCRAFCKETMVSDGNGVCKEIYHVLKRIKAKLSGEMDQPLRQKGALMPTLNWVMSLTLAPR